jgi:hypothetical protein
MAVQDRPRCLGSTPLNLVRPDEEALSPDALVERFFFEGEKKGDDEVRVQDVHEMW